MADETTSSIDVSASATAVMGVIADLEAYPDWVTGIRSAEVLTRFDDGRAEQARFTVQRHVVEDDRFNQQVDVVGCHRCATLHRATSVHVANLLVKRLFRGVRAN